MRFLIVSHDLEDTNYRGVQFVTKHVVKALSQLGHEVILLTSHPKVKMNVHSKRLQERVLNTYLRQYLMNGAQLNAKMFARKKIDYSSTAPTYITPGPIEIFFQTVSSFLLALVSKLVTLKVDKRQTSGIELVKYIDESVNFPSFYRLANAMPKIFRRIALEKVVKQVNADIVFVGFPLLIPKLKSAKVVQVIYDLIPFEIAEEPIEFGWLPKLAQIIDYVTRNSDQVFTISRDSQRRILEVEPDAKVRLIGAAISAYRDEISTYTEDSPIINKLNLQDKPYLVFISSVEKRKNVHRLIQAFISIANENSASLIIVGNKPNVFGEIYKELEGVPEEIVKRVIFTGYVSEFDKYTLLKHAVALVNPTLYEGFGLPVLEAFVLGCPVVASATGALIEISGDATLPIKNPYSISEISGALREIMTNASLREELIKKGFVQSEKYTEEVMQSRIKEAIAELE